MNLLMSNLTYLLLEYQLQAASEEGHGVVANVEALVVVKLAQILDEVADGRLRLIQRYILLHQLRQYRLQLLCVLRR